MQPSNNWLKAWKKKLVPAFIREDYSPYACKVTSNKENYGFRGRMVHVQNLIKTMINLKRLPFPSPIQCKNCLFDTRIPNIYITRRGICNMCETYQKNFDPAVLKDELHQFLTREKEPGAQYDAIMAFSGGKDSTVSLYIAVKEYGLKVMAVLVDNGFIPEDVIENGREICGRMGVPLRVERIDFMPKLVELMKTNFASGYPCNVCTVMFHDVMAEVCREQKVNRVILGRNWWRILEPVVKSVRRIRPPGCTWDIDFLSLPFALQLKEESQLTYLQKAGWKARGIYGHSTNCLIPGLVEKAVYDRIGYHPELNLVSREVIVGFLTKEKALQKLSSVRDLSSLLKMMVNSYSRRKGAEEKAVEERFPGLN